MPESPTTQVLVADEFKRQIRNDIQPRADRSRVRAIILVSEEEDFDDIRSETFAKDSLKTQSVSRKAN
jgi:hypothetical protein